jgi:hypothetical protein
MSFPQISLNRRQLLSWSSTIATGVCPYVNHQFRNWHDSSFSHESIPRARGQIAGGGE